MNRIIIIGGAVVLAAVIIFLILRIIGFRETEVEIPCGQNLLSNGSFEQGNFNPTAEGFMSLNNNSTDLQDWSVSVNNNPLAWLQTGNRFVLSASDQLRFLDLSGARDRDLFPALSQTVSLRRGRYQLKLDLGQDLAHSFPGPVSADVVTRGVIPSSVTFTTVPGGANWQTFTELLDSGSNGQLTVAFGAQKGQTKNFIGLDNVSLQEFLPVGKCLR